MCSLTSSRNKIGLLMLLFSGIFFFHLQKATSILNLVNLCLTVCHLGIYPKTVCCCALPDFELFTNRIVYGL